MISVQKKTNKNCKTYQSFLTHAIYLMFYLIDSCCPSQVSWLIDSIMIGYEWGILKRPSHSKQSSPLCEKKKTLTVWNEILYYTPNSTKSMQENHCHRMLAFIYICKYLILKYKLISLTLHHCSFTWYSTCASISGNIFSEMALCWEIHLGLELHTSLQYWI